MARISCLHRADMHLCLACVTPRGRAPGGRWIAASCVAGSPSAKRRPRPNLPLGMGLAPCQGTPSRPFGLSSLPRPLSQGAQHHDCPGSPHGHRPQAAARCIGNQASAHLCPAGSAAPHGRASDGANGARCIQAGMPQHPAMADPPGTHAGAARTDEPRAEPRPDDSTGTRLR